MRTPSFPKSPDILYSSRGISPGELGMIRKLDLFIDRYSLITISLGIFLFLQPFTRHSGVRNTAIGILVLCLTIKTISGRFRPVFSDSTVMAFFALAGAVLLSAAFSPYPGESFHAIRKNLFYQAIIFFTIITQYRCFSSLRPLFLFMLTGYAALTLKVIALSDLSDLLNWLHETHNGNTLLRSYSTFATFFIPLGAAYLYSFREKRFIAVLLVSFLSAEAVLSILNNHRSQVVAFTAALLVITLAAKRYRALVAGLLAMLIAVSALVSIKPDVLDRYKTVLDAGTYVSNENHAMNGRLGIWRGVIDMIEDRPVLGWGYGWKKVYNAAYDGGYMDRWDKESYTYRYFRDGSYGSVNHHNLILQVLFEAGIAGLIAFAAFWATVAIKAASVMREAGRAALFLKYAVPGVLLSYMIVNLVNGFWEEAYGNLMTAFAASCVVLHREAKQRDHDEEMHPSLAAGG